MGNLGVWDDGQPGPCMGRCKDGGAFVKTLCLLILDGGGKDEE